jgi:hypothetical protein
MFGLLSGTSTWFTCVSRSSTVTGEATRVRIAFFRMPIISPAPTP